MIVWNKKFYHCAKFELYRIKDAKVFPSVQLRALCWPGVKPKKGWTLPGHNFTGPYNPLEKQVKYDPEAGEILGIYQPPTGATDAIAMQQDVDYDVCSNCEKNMVKISKNANTKRIKKW